MALNMLRIKKQFHFLVLFGLTLGLSSGACWAAQDWEFQDGFETVAGTAPGNPDDADPDPAIWNFVDIWENSNSGNTQVFNDPAGAFSGDNYVEITTTGWTMMERSWGHPADLPDISWIGPGENFTIEFAVNPVNLVHGAQVFIGRRNDPAGGNIQQGFGMGIQGGELTYFNTFGAGCNNAQCSLSTPFFGIINGHSYSYPGYPDVFLDPNGVDPDAWYVIRMVSRMDPDQIDPPTFELYLDNELVAADLPWNIPDYAFANANPGMNSLQVSAHPGSLYEGAYFDNFRLIEGEIPEDCAGMTTFLPADLNFDCYVNELDLFEFVNQWLDCTDPADPVSCAEL